MPEITEEKLISDGWEKRATYDDPRLSEMVALYEEIGLEVHLEPLHPSREKGCTDCMNMSPDRFKTIYTREKSKLRPRLSSEEVAPKGQSDPDI
jgi:hypothetical protein